METKFELGSLTVTKSISDRIAAEESFKRFVQLSLGKYVNCDWGNTCEEDKKQNDEAVRIGERTLAVYIYPKTKEKIWIITERDRSATTVLYPEEY